MSNESELNPDVLNRYDRMSAEELAAVLRADSEANDSSELDSETLLYVMRLYAQRQTDKPTKSAEEAFAAFRRDYLPRAHEPSVWTQEVTDLEDSRKRRSKIKLWRSMTAAAATLALVLGVGTLVQSQLNRGGGSACWQDRDYLAVGDNYSTKTVQHVPQAAQKWYPQWLPEDFERVRFQWNDGYYGISYHRVGGGKFDTLNICFKALTPGGAINFYKNPKDAEPFVHDGVRFYRYTNMKRVCAMGYLNGVVISVDGMISEEELLRIVQSMQFV